MAFKKEINKIIKMKITIVIEGEDIQIKKEKPKLGGIKKKIKNKVGKVKKLTPEEKKRKKKMAEGEEQEMIKSLKKIGVQPK